jgi:hypothetical protein
MNVFIELVGFRSGPDRWISVLERYRTNNEKKIWWCINWRVKKKTSDKNEEKVKRKINERKWKKETIEENKERKERKGVGRAKSVQRQATGWKTGVPFPAGVNVQTDSGVYLDACRMGTGGYFPGATASRVKNGGSIPPFPHTFEENM